MKNKIIEHNPEKVLEDLYNKKANIELSKKLISELKKKYVYNENIVENVKAKEEKDGLNVVFDFISEEKFVNMENIYVLLKIHSLLYSKVPFKGFGGSFRTSNAYISNSSVNTTEPNLISDEVHKLYKDFDEAMKLAEKINNSHDNKIVIKYIRKAIDIKCRLIEIHPFSDGNGRSCRALVNLMLKKIGIPPVYIDAKEKDTYISAMNLAITENNKNKIDRIYYKKIIENLEKVNNERKKR